jgi:DNA-directed RNA polymerase beta subunit
MATDTKEITLRMRTSSNSPATVKNGVPMATPVFDGARESDVSTMLRLAGLDTSGQVRPV